MIFKLSAFRCENVFTFDLDRGITHLQSGAFLKCGEKAFLDSKIGV
jgi:hypothetical protein